MQPSSRRGPVWWSLTLIGVALLAALIISERDLLADTWQTIIKADLRLVLLLPLLQMNTYFWVGQYYRSMFSFFKAKISVARSWGVVAALNFVNQILPSGGMSGVTYLAYGFRNQVPVGTTGLIQLGRYVLSMVSYLILGPIVILLAILGGQSQWLNETLGKALHAPQVWLVGGAFMLVVLLAWKVFHRRDNSKRVAGRTGVFINRLASFIRRKPVKVIKKGQFEKLAQDFHNGAEFIFSDHRRAVKPLLFMMLSTLSDLAIVYCAFQAVGGDINVAVLFVSFIAANIAGVVSVIPGDVGVHEGVMIVMLSTLGADPSIAISATLLYRIFNKIVYLPIGFLFYTKLLKPAEEGHVG